MTELTTAPHVMDRPGGRAQIVRSVKRNIAPRRGTDTPRAGVNCDVRTRGVIGREVIGLAFDAQPRRVALGADLLSRSDLELVAARQSTDPAERFGHARLAALRVAGAVLEASAAKPPRGRTRSAWERLGAVSAEFASWATHFAAGASLRAAIEAGRFDAVDQDCADGWVEAAEDFRDAVGQWLRDMSPVDGALTGMST